MRIAYVGGGRLDSFMADVVHVLQTVDAFSQLGHEVTLFARQGDLSPEELKDRYDLLFSPRCVLMRGRDWRQPWSRFSRVGNALAMSRIVRRSGQYDLILGREPYSIWPLLGSGCPIIYEAHEMPGPFQTPLLRHMLSHADMYRVVVISSTLRDDYLDAFPALDPGRIRVVPNGVQESAIDLPHSPVALPGRQDALRVGFVGALYHGKGMEVVLPVASELTECDFHVVGGRPEDVEYWEKRSPPRNVYMHGLKPRREIFGFLDAFDIVLLPSQPDIQSFSGRMTRYGRWTSPMKLFEYMSRGKAVVASDLPGVREVADDSALLVPPGDLLAWQQAISTLVRDPALRRQLGSAARQKCRTRFTTLAGARARLEGLVS